VVYVLGSYYGWGREVIANRLLDLLGASVLVVLEQATLRQALTWYRDVPGVHFADAYVAALAAARGHGAVMTFDRAMRRIPGIRVVGEPRELPGRGSGARATRGPAPAP
jgi:predicted nucleic acid-binding protein